MSPLTGSDPSSPRQAFSVPHANHDREEVSVLSAGNHLEESTLDNFLDMHSLRLLSEDDIVKATTEALAKKRPSPFNSATMNTTLASLNTILQELAIRDSNGSAASAFQCFSGGSRTPEGHPTETTCRPDACIVAPGNVEVIRSGFQTKRWQWSTFELVIEFGSSGKTYVERLKQTAAYLHYMLLARPDINVGQAMLIDGKATARNKKLRAVTFLFGSAGSGVISHTKLACSSKDFLKTLIAFLWRLNCRPADSGMLSPSIRLAYNQTIRQCRFDVIFKLPLAEEKGATDDSDSQLTGPEVVCRGYHLGHSHSPFGKRTHVFLSPPESATVINGQPARAIKLQYIRQGSRFTEQAVLNELLRDGPTPGVVDSLHTERIQVFGNRYVTAVAMASVGESFHSAATIREGIMILYDLLEVTRFIYKERKILHRDINLGNVLISRNSKFTPATQSNKDRLQSLRFIGSLLEPTSKGQWDTDLLLIDFGEGQIGSSATEATKSPPALGHVGSGSSLFMAKDVVDQSIAGVAGYLMYPGQPAIPASYAEFHPQRAEEFPFGTDQDTHDLLLKKSNVTLSGYELYHDAESIFWFLYHWIQMVEPRDGAKELIPPVVWSIMHNANTRTQWHSGFAHTFDKSFPRQCPPTFSVHSQLFSIPLVQLIVDMIKYLDPSPYWIHDSEDPAVANSPWKKPDFIHEAFQRLILTFLENHGNDENMLRPLSGSFRNPQTDETRASSKTTINGTGTSKRGLEDLDDGDSILGPPIKKSKNPTRSSTLSVSYTYDFDLDELFE